MKNRLSTTKLFHRIAQASSLHQAVEAGTVEMNLKQQLEKLLEESGLDIPTLAQKMVASRVHMYQIFEGIRKPGRNMLLRMAFALSLSLEETQRLLTVAQRGVLYPRVRRDSAIIFMLQHGYTLPKADEALREIHEQPLVATVE